MKPFSLPQKNMNGERGQSLVELAISLIVLLFLLLGAVEFSLALFQYVTIRDAAQEGALYGSINPTDEDGIKDRAVAAAADVLPTLTTAAVTVETDRRILRRADERRPKCHQGDHRL
jgi:Flp pilus assembly protein TadG